ncbi:MAG TPA: 3'-5' exonuclease, partial [Xanthobacteraceae bacterium]
LDYERRETPSLQGFLAWLRQARAEVKRDMEIARDEVRVMTVHGAKGLEAPIVILADTMTPPAGPRQPRLLTLPGKAVIWAGRKADDAPPVAAARQAALDEARDEYRRLLYVAMTRAEDRLIVCGADGERKRPEGCWYDLIRQALDGDLFEETHGEEKVLRYRKTAAPAPSSPLDEDKDKSEQSEFPAWLRQPAPSYVPPPTPLSPSSAFDDEIGETAPGASRDRRKALERGRIVHRLMQSLPDVPPARRQDAAERYLANAAKHFSAAERAEIARQVLAILDNENFAGVFASGSRAEVPIVGRIPRKGDEPVLVAGQVDRLVVTADTVLVVDYKSDSLVPTGVEAAPAAYITQLALYRAVLMRLYPERTVRAALIFSNAPALIEIPASVMAAALAAELGKKSTKSCNSPVSAA